MKDAAVAPGAAFFVDRQGNQVGRMQIQPELGWVGIVMGWLWLHLHGVGSGCAVWSYCFLLCCLLSWASGSWREVLREREARRELVKAEHD